MSDTEDKNPEITNTNDNSKEPETVEVVRDVASPPSSERLVAEDASLIRALLDKKSALGNYLVSQHFLAAAYNVDSGRICEINKADKFPIVPMKTRGVRKAVIGLKRTALTRMERQFNELLAALPPDL